jgi:hypothetical protein
VVKDGGVGAYASVCVDQGSRLFACGDVEWEAEVKSEAFQKGGLSIRMLDRGGSGVKLSVPSAPL